MAIITACFGAFDPVKKLPEHHGFTEAICVTDRPDLVPDGWSVRYEKPTQHPRLQAKRPKMTPWLYTDLPSLWIDASIEVTSTQLHSWTAKHLRYDDFVVWRHPENRFDFVDEAVVCMDWPKYRDYNIRGQVDHYLSKGMPRGWGLFACGSLAMRPTKEVRFLGARWLMEQEQWSIQDQVSLPYLLWDMGLQFGTWQAHQYSNPFLRVRWDQRPNPAV